MESYTEKICTEIKLTIRREYIKNPSSAIDGKSVEIKKKLTNLKKQEGKSDNANIDYALGGTANQSNIRQNEIFCDNAFVLTPLENKYVVKINEKTKKKFLLKIFLHSS